MRKNFLVLLISLLFLPSLVLADAPPPPPFVANFTYEGQQISDIKFFAETLRCNKEKSDNIRTDIMPQLLISEVDSERGCTWEPEISADNCANSQCNFDWTLGEFKIAVYVPSLSRTFVSGVINRKYLGYYGRQTQTVYDINLLKDNSVLVKNIDIDNLTFVDEVYGGAFWAVLGFSLLATIILESIVALIFILKKKAPKAIFFALLIGNIISIPFVWIVTIVAIFSSIALFIAEIIAVFFEAWLIKLFAKNILSWKICLLISLIMNIVSFIAGPFLITLFNYI